MSKIVIFTLLLSHILVLEKGVCNPIKPSVTLQIPMRDGFELPTNIYLPSESDKRYPCILIRHPLGHHKIDSAWIELTQKGYVIAVQATRSFCDETGQAIPYVTDGWGDLKDGYDAVEYLAHSPYSNGKVGTLGVSAAGITQFLMAPSAPPSLRCQYITMAAPSLLEYAVYPGGQLRKNQVEGWLQSHQRTPHVIEVLKKHRLDPLFWEQFNALQKISRVKAAQIHIGGWYDIFLQGTIDAFLAGQNSVQGLKKQYQKLIIGPWTHYWPHTDNLGEFKVSEIGKAPPYPINHLMWFDYHLKGLKNALELAPDVQYYVMGPFDGSKTTGNVWRTASTWPPKADIYTFYVDSNNSLTQTLPQQSSQIPVLFNVNNPVPTLGGRNLFLPSGPKDQRSVEARKDVVVFTSKPLENDLEVTGRISARFFVTCSSHERDLALRLCDVYPDGRSILIAEGIAHIPAFESESSQNHIQAVNVDLWSTSIVFAQGHQIRLSASGSNFPGFEVSLEKSQGDNAELCFSICSGGKNASSIDLPVIHPIASEISTPLLHEHISAADP